MLNWANRFNIFCFLDNHGYSIQPQEYQCLLGAGVAAIISSDQIEDVDKHLQKGWWFGHLSYDLKNSLHGMRAAADHRIGFPPFSFFSPQVILQLDQSSVTITADDPAGVMKEILAQSILNEGPNQPFVLQQRLDKAGYIEKINALQAHIKRGDCYEINFCQEFYAESVSLNPVSVFEKLTLLSPTPFSAFYKLEDKFLICASPERYLHKKGNRIQSQPMKGTIRRSADDTTEDELLRETLKESPKDRSENVMVVDMVRNDLSRICKQGSVKVDELYGVYSYPQVHQMISTVSGELKDKIRFSDIIRASFPMGSMTGAPKHRVMELIDAYEVSPRGIFSGSVGYINPGGDFDFNVVIRSIMYNAGSGYLSYQVGSGITFYSEPEKEWEECLLKGEAIKKVLTGKSALE